MSLVNSGIWQGILKSAPSIVDSFKKKPSQSNITIPPIVIGNPQPVKQASEIDEKYLLIGGAVLAAILIMKK